MGQDRQCERRGHRRGDDRARRVRHLRRELRTRQRDRAGWSRRRSRSHRSTRCRRKSSRRSASSRDSRSRPARRPRRSPATSRDTSQGVNDGKTYAETSAAARAEGLDPNVAAELAGKADILFKGETLRSIMLNAYGWWTVATIALYVGYAMIALGHPARSALDPRILPREAHRDGRRSRRCRHRQQQVAGRRIRLGAHSYGTTDRPGYPGRSFHARRAAGMMGSVSRPVTHGVTLRYGDDRPSGREMVSCRSGTPSG